MSSRRPTYSQMGIFEPINKLLPNRCVLCNFRSEENICPGCDYDLPLITSPCFRCGLPVGKTEQASPTPESLLCGQCLVRPPPFDHTIAALDYRFPVTVLVQRFKFRRGFACGVVLAKKLAAAIELQPPNPIPEFLVPVPLHPIRQFTRVFNQAEILAEDLGRHFNLPLKTRALRRIRRTRFQPGLSADALPGEFEDL